MDAVEEAKQQLTQVLDVDTVSEIVLDNIRMNYPDLDEEELEEFHSDVLDEMHATLAHFRDQVIFGKVFSTPPE